MVLDENVCISTRKNLNCQTDAFRAVKNFEGKLKNVHQTFSEEVVGRIWNRCANEEEVSSLRTAHLKCIFR